MFPQYTSYIQPEQLLPQQSSIYIQNRNFYAAPQPTPIQIATNIVDLATATLRFLMLG